MGARCVFEDGIYDALDYVRDKNPHPYGWGWKHAHSFTLARDEEASSFLLDGDVRESLGGID
jgi:hypothetical protein